MKAPRILIIEDELEILDNMKILLELEGFDIIKAINGIDGFDKASKLLPALILCDIAMPGLNGFEVLSKLSENTDTNTIPFIFLTAKTERDDVRNAMELGADDYITKPFTSDELINAVKIRLKKFDIIKTKMLKTRESVPKNNKGKLFGINDTIFLSHNKASVPVKINSIEYIASQNQVTKIFAGDTEFVLKRPLSFWAAILPSDKFMKIHRSVIVNLHFVEKIEKADDNSFRVFIQNGKAVYKMSRRYYNIIKSVLPE